MVLSKWENGVKIIPESLPVHRLHLCVTAAATPAGLRFEDDGGPLQKSRGRTAKPALPWKRAEKRIATLLMWPLSRSLMAGSWWLEGAGISVNVTSDWFRGSGAPLFYIHTQMHTHIYCKNMLIHTHTSLYIYKLFFLWNITHTCTKGTHSLKFLEHTRTDTQKHRLSSPQGRSLPKCSAVDKLSLKWSSSANRVRQSLGKWLCNQPLLTPFNSCSHSHTHTFPSSDYYC